MYLVMLMAVPVLAGLAGLVWTKGRITLLEFGAMELATLLVVASGWGIARYGSTSDVEVWNGRVIDKHSQRVSCEHAHTICTSNGKTTTCHTWYEHGYDVSWYVYSSSTDRFEIDRVDRQGLKEPPRFTKAYVGEPTAATHSYTNYIKAHPDSVLRRVGTTTKFPKAPDYPAKQYNYYYVDRFVSNGVPERNLKDWIWLLQQANADLGGKQANVVVVLTSSPDSSFEYALEEQWIGGKKNDVVVVIGVPQYPAIAWVRVLGWTKSDDVKVHIRDHVMDLRDIRRRDEIVAVIKQDVLTYYVRKPMEDFKYLMAGYQPGTEGTLVLFFLGLVVCGGLWGWFYTSDPFDSGYSHRPYGGYSRY